MCPRYYRSADARMRTQIALLAPRLLYKRPDGDNFAYPAQKLKLLKGCGGGGGGVDDAVCMGKNSLQSPLPWLNLI